MRKFTALNHTESKSKYLVIRENIIVPALIIGLLSLLYFTIFHTSLLAIRHINCELDYQPCENEHLLAELNKYSGHNMFRLKKEEVLTKLTAGDFTVRGGDIYKHYPETLNVSLHSTYPVVSVKIKGGSDEWFVFDHKGRFLRMTKSDPNVPVVLVTDLEPMHLGQSVNNSKLQDAMQFAVKIEPQISGVKELELQDSALYLLLDNGIRATLSTSMPLDQQLSTLQAVLRDPTMLEGVTSIDVRFDKPVLKFN